MEVNISQKAMFSHKNNETNSTYLNSKVKCQLSCGKQQWNVTVYSITTPSTIFKIPHGLGIHKPVILCLPELMKETTNLYIPYIISII